MNFVSRYGKKQSMIEKKVLFGMWDGHVCGNIILSIHGISTNFIRFMKGELEIFRARAQ
jgi:hypothetical protein